MGALDAVAGWPVGAAAAAVVGPDGVLETCGDVEVPYELASVTKPLVALAVLVAVEEGALGLDDPAGPPGSTVRHLLAHASGLAMDKHGSWSPSRAPGGSTPTPASTCSATTWPR